MTYFSGARNPKTGSLSRSGAGETAAQTIGKVIERTDAILEKKVPMPRILAIHS